MDTKDKIAAFNRYIAQQREEIVKLEARVREAPKEHRAYFDKQLAHARMRLAELKEQKKRPATLLTVEALLRDGSLKEGLERTLRVEGKEAFEARMPGLLAAVAAEQERINLEYFKRNDSQRDKAQKPRAIVDGGMGDLVAALVKKHPVDATPSELWPHMQNDIAVWFQCDCELIENDRNPRYEYEVESVKTLKSGAQRTSIYKRTLRFKYFEELLRKTREDD